MRRITDSFIKNIVRQSLNESYGLLNEYDITTTIKIGDIPIGTFVSGMTLPECPEGGFCYGSLDMAKKDAESLSAGGSGGLIQKYCPSKNVPSRKGKGLKMGKPTYNVSKIQQLSGELWEELTDAGMDPADIKNGLRSLENFPNFCKSEELFYSYWSDQPTSNPSYGVGSVYNGFEGTNWYGIINDDSDDRDNYFNQIAQLFQNSIDISDEQYAVWLAELNAKYKITKDAADKNKNDLENKKKNDETIQNLIKKGGGGMSGQGWITEHPALGKNLLITNTEGDCSVYSLNTSNPNIDKWLYGIMVRKDNGTVQHVKFLSTDTSTPYPIDGQTDVWVKWSISKSDIWKYDDVVLTDGNIALTTDPAKEKKFTTESYRHKGFRHNLLTEADGKTKEEYPACVQNLGDVVVGGSGVSSIKDKEGNLYFTNNRVLLRPGVQGNPSKVNPTMVDYFCDSKGVFKFGKAAPAPVFELSFAKKSKGDDVKLIQQKLGIPVDGGFGTGTETAVIEFQTNNRKDLPNAVSGVVDQTTFDLIKKYTVNDAGINKVYSGVKTTYTQNDWIYVNPKLGSEGDLLAEKKYFKIKSITPDRYTVVLDSTTKETFDVSNVGGVTAKILFGRDAEAGSQTGPNNTNDSGNKEKGKRNKVVDNSRDNSRDNSIISKTKIKGVEGVKDIRNKEFCDNVRQIKQYINTNKGGDLPVDCQKTQKTLNQIMMALTGGTPVNPVNQPQYNVVQPVPVRDTLF